MSTLGFGGKNIIDIVKYRWYFIGFSALFVIPAIVMMIYSTIQLGSPVRLGIDFTGGTLLQYGFERKLDVADIGDIRKVLAQIGQENSVIQIQQAADILGQVKMRPIGKVSQPANEATNENANTTVNEQTTQPANQPVNESSTTAPTTVNKTEQKAETKSVNQASNTTANETTAPTVINEPVDNQEANNTEKSKESTISSTGAENINVQSMVSIRSKFLSEADTKKLDGLLQNKFGDFTVIQVSAIGPALGKELFKNAMIALLLVFGAIVVYLSVRFQLDYAVCALFALLHDAVFVIGLFAFFGLFYNTEVDSLFVSAILTVIGFSVHDTIVVFDRIRENARFLSKKKSFGEIANDSVNQTLARSINTSLTTIFVLLCLYFFGGVTTKDFVLAMALGILIGTYSSIFNASVLLTMWRELNAPKQRKRKATAS